MTNYEQIKNMSLEQLSEFLTYISLSMMADDVAKVLSENRKIQIKAMLQDDINK